MPKVRVNYDGWIALPSLTRRQLGLATGSELELDVADGTIILRPVGAAATATDHSPAEPAPAALPGPGTAQAMVPAVPPPLAKREPGRPREVTPAAPSPSLKPRGRRKTGTGQATL